MKQNYSNKNLKNQLLTIENPQAEKILRKPSKRVENPQSTEMILLAQLMTKYCQQPGVAGIAAPQLGYNYRLFALSNGEKHPPIFFYNPRIVEVGEDTSTEMEGCLSVPGKGGLVTRPNTNTLEWRDKDNKKYSFQFNGFWARAVDHEMKHLSGELYIDICDNVLSEEEMQKQFEEAKEKERALDELASAAETEMTSVLHEMEVPNKEA